MKYLNDYKGKHFVLSDDDDDMFGSIGIMEEKELTDAFLISHVDACSHYGIPAYIGKDKTLQDRIDKIYGEIERE